MLFTFPRRALFPGLMASAVVLAGTTACSRPDRSESGVDNTAAVTQDTTSTAPAAADTTTAGMESGTAIGDTAPARIQPDAPRAATAPAEGRPQDTSLQGDTAGDTSAAGYRAMERDTGGAAVDTAGAADTIGVPQSDSARVTEDTSETSLNPADTAAVETAGAAEPADTISMAMPADDNILDTSAVETAGAAEYSDTISTPAADDTSSAELAVELDTAAAEAEVSDTAAAGYAEMARDTTTIADQIDTTGAAVEAEGAVQARVDTTTTEAGVTADADVSADADLAVGAADTVDNAGRIRPPEDSTEILGQVTTDTSVTVAATDTAESEHIRPPEDSTELAGTVTGETADEQEVDADEAIAAEDRETVATSETAADEVGAAAVGGTVTGAEAASLMTRQGIRCSVLDPETNEEVRWDMSSTPVTLNPCGLGSMNLSKVWTER